jgi:hypothetical protein
LAEGEAVKKKGFVSVAIEESDEEEEEVTIRPTTRLESITSKFPLTE